MITTDNLRQVCVKHPENWDKSEIIKHWSHTRPLKLWASSSSLHTLLYLLSAPKYTKVHWVIVTADIHSTIYPEWHSEIKTDIQKAKQQLQVGVIEFDVLWLLEQEMSVAQRNAPAPAVDLKGMCHTKFFVKCCEVFDSGNTDTCRAKLCCHLFNLETAITSFSVFQDRYTPVIPYPLSHSLMLCFAMLFDMVNILQQFDRMGLICVNLLLLKCHSWPTEFELLSL